MIPQKKKVCKPIGKAKGYKGACGETKYIKQYGLCPACLYDFFTTTDNGKLLHQKYFIPKVSKRTEARDKETTTKLKDGSRSANYYPNILQAQINLICRLIDKDTGCISCNGKTTPAGGHYHSRGGNPSLRYHLDNIHLQDFNCNNMKGANIPKYDLGLIERYGRLYWEHVKFDLVREYPYLKLHQNDYPTLIQKAKVIVKELKAVDGVYTPSERLELRLKYTKTLGIYPVKPL